MGEADHHVVLGTGQIATNAVERELTEPGLALLVLTLEATDELGLATDGFEIDADPGELSAIDPMVRRLVGRLATLTVGSARLVA
ncbi:MAG TPA: hypothetical protein PKM36_05000 [Propionibacteriaceae bacterium]|nr:hypothetical protein [Propionibacteriaceae bacterium]